MVQIPGAMAATIVRRRGATKAGIGLGIGGIAGAAIATRRAKGTTPMRDQFAFLAVFNDRVVLFQAKGAFRSKPTDVVLGEEDRTGARATFTTNRSWGVLELFFDDGSLWEFDIPRAGLGDARVVADTLGRIGAVKQAADPLEQ
jgi:hypothetical protein